MNVEIRPIEAEDAPTVADIWQGGLQQTAEEWNMLLRPLIQHLMFQLGKTATSETGDVGPNGSKLMERWSNKEDRCMFVACLSGSNTVVGVVGVKRGLTSDDVEPDATEACISRMSVSPTVRRQGVGLALMMAAEEHARTAWNCVTMKLFTANSIAAKFYMTKASYQQIPNKVPWYDVFNISGHAHWYEKKLQKS